ncbi:crk-like protein [Bolinopsis microptera]|uniref:crk-like protein n=1 Tax=Bolinopsis microptera TaxID=2820187 RepID=UPI00307AC552
MSQDYSRELWYVGKITRAVTNQLLLDKESGLYLVRDSSTCQGDYVLCVSENNKVSNYIINSKPNGCYKIGENIFDSLQKVIKFYTDSLLDTTTLKRIVVIEKVRGKYDFPGRDEEDLPFRKGELLYVIEKPEEQWWEALNQEGKTGSIPAPYVTVESTVPPPVSTPVAESAVPVPPPQPAAVPLSAPLQPPPPPLNSMPRTSSNASGSPVTAVAIMDRNPSAYDQKFLAFKAGDIIRVTKQNEDGLWEGECEGRTGLFPFNHVKVQAS